MILGWEVHQFFQIFISQKGTLPTSSIRKLNLKGALLFMERTRVACPLISTMRTRESWATRIASLSSGVTLTTSRTSRCGNTVAIPVYANSDEKIKCITHYNQLSHCKLQNSVKNSLRQLQNRKLKRISLLRGLIICYICKLHSIRRKCPLKSQQIVTIRSFK